MPSKAHKPKNIPLEKRDRRITSLRNEIDDLKQQLLDKHKTAERFTKKFLKINKALSVQYNALKAQLAESQMQVSELTSQLASSKQRINQATNIIFNLQDELHEKNQQIEALQQELKTIKIQLDQSSEHAVYHADKADDLVAQLENLALQEEEDEQTSFKNVTEIELSDEFNQTNINSEDNDIVQYGTNSNSNNSYSQAPSDF